MSNLIPISAGVSAGVAALVYFAYALNKASR